MKSWFIWKDPDAGKDWRREKKETTEDETVGWHRRLNRQEFEQAPGVGDGKGGLACCSPWGRKESGMTERLNWTALKFSNFSKIVQHTQINFLSIIIQWILSLFPKKQRESYFRCLCELWQTSLYFNLNNFQISSKQQLQTAKFYFLLTLYVYHMSLLRVQWEVLFYIIFSLWLNLMENSLLGKLWVTLDNGTGAWLSTIDCFHLEKIVVTFTHIP